MQSVILKVQGMSCGHCVSSVEGAVRKLGATAKVDLNGGLVTVEYDDNKLTLDAIKATIEDQGYDVIA
jgi:copper chaperone